MTRATPHYVQPRRSVLQMAPGVPDYVLYKGAAAVEANKNRTLDEEMLRESAFAVGDAKYWYRPLDVSLKGRGDPFTNKNLVPDRLLHAHAGTEWGDLTNGQLWRLYHPRTKEVTPVRGTKLVLAVAAATSATC